MIPRYTQSHTCYHSNMYRYLFRCAATRNGIVIQARDQDRVIYNEPGGRTPHEVESYNVEETLRTDAYIYLFT